MAGGPNPDIAAQIASENAIGDALPANDTGSEVRPDGEAGGGGAVGLKPEDVERLIGDKLSGALEPLNSKIAELSQENAFLRGRALQQQQPPAAPAAQPPPAKSWRESVTEEQIVEQLRTNPVATLDKLVGDTLERALKPILERVDGVSQNVTQSQKQQQFDRAATTDIEELNRDYGYLKGQPDFEREASAEFARLTANGYQTGMLWQAAARAANKLMREGKLGGSRTPAPNGNGNGSVNGTISMSRALRDQNSHGAENSAGIGGEAAGGGVGEPKSIDELVSKGILNRTEAVAARKINAKWGVSEADYVRNYMAGRSNDPHFGER